jgi:hypothetical protein
MLVKLMVKHADAASLQGGGERRGGAGASVHGGVYHPPLQLRLNEVKQLSPSVKQLSQQETDRHRDRETEKDGDRDSERQRERRGDVRASVHGGVCHPALRLRVRPVSKHPRILCPSTNTLPYSRVTSSRISGKK